MPAVKVLVSQIVLMVGALKNRNVARLEATVFLTETAPSLSRLSSEATYVAVSMAARCQSVDFIAVARIEDSECLKECLSRPGITISARDT